MIGHELDDLEAISSTAERVIDRTETPILKATGLGRRGVLEPADLEVFDGEIVGIAGLLGSGRTELVRLLYGADRADSGHIEVGGTSVRMTSPRHAIDHRIAFSSEDRREEGIVSDLTVAENIVLGIQARKGRKIRSSNQESVVSEYLTALDIRPADPEHDRWQPVGGQPAEGAHRSLARNCARATDPGRADSRHRCRHQSRPATKVAELSEKGLSVIFISSELEEVLRLAQRVVVMRDRKCIGEIDSRHVELNGLIDFIANAGKVSA